nr:immunoglobulin light chain junction region [Mus musculus]NSM00203.1 immunoglobulin light chain junction region [Mus musculus]NSM01774.1 immunoglobulin light chain junction region [Mus musculus]NSM01836.1 immunoglobulin light chain junction region [Mus musculus]
CLQHWNYPYTF